MMKKILFTVCLFPVLGIGSCNSQDDKVHDPIENPPPNPSPELPDLGPPVETAAPNSSYTPAFEGQTRVGSLTTTTPYQIEVIASNLGNPWGIVNMPDGRLLITQKSGSMVIYSTSGALEKNITGFPSVANSGQGGLLDVADR